MVIFLRLICVGPLAILLLHQRYARLLFAIVLLYRSKATLLLPNPLLQLSLVKGLL